MSSMTSNFYTFKMDSILERTKSYLEPRQVHIVAHFSKNEFLAVKSMKRCCYYYYYYY